MSKVDDVFGPIPGPLIQEWGQPATFVSVGSSVLDPNTGDMVLAETRIPVKVVITKVTPMEVIGNYQATDWKVMLDPGQIGGRYITTKDRFEVDQDGRTVVAKVIEPGTYRGDSPVFFICIARPQ